jgi:hypothetical protein
MSDIRNISLTPFLSKLCERIILDNLTPVLSKVISRTQFGSRKGTSTEHLIAFLLDLAAEATDKGSGVVGVTSLDFSKAFNRMSHDVLIDNLVAAGADAWIIKVIESYLSNRQMRIRVGNQLSSPKPLPGGTPQGSLLGVSLFILYVNEISELESDNVKCLQYVDDTYLIETVVQDKEHFIKHIGAGREKRMVPLNGTQSLIDQIDKIAKSKMMKLNTEKTNVMFILPERVGWDPEFEVRVDGDVINGAKTCLRILGLLVSSDMRTSLNTDARIKAAASRTWIIKLLKEREVESHDLIEIYKTLIRPVLEYGMRCLGSMMTRLEIERMERIQRMTLKMIYGTDTSYEETLILSGLRH